MVVGIITNSDDRVIPILSSLHTSVTARRYSPDAKAFVPAWSRDNSDVQFVTLSYDVGFEKPDRRIFDVAKELVSVDKGIECDYVHVGDDVENDARGAEAAGWNGVVLDRDNQHRDKGLPRVSSLLEVGDMLWNEGAYGTK